MRGLGKGLQRVGLLLPLASIVLQLSNSISVGQMFVMLVASVAAFSLGRLIEGYAR